jgi:DegV family protein with EDD domain
MESKIIVDSCCDLTPELERHYNTVSVPLSMVLGNDSFVDDETLNLNEFLEKMKNYKGRVGSSCPSPEVYREQFEGTHTSYAVTLSSNLSGSYASAMAAKASAEENGARVHVFDSKSASAAEVLIVHKLKSLIDAGEVYEKIVSTVENFIKGMKTYFVLDSLDNLMKNGRLSKIKGKLLNVLNIKPIMGEDGEGNIILFSHGRGENQLIELLADTIENSGKKTDGECLVITHCNNPGFAQRLLETIKSRYNFKEILKIPTRGLSSLYANDKGVIMAF